MHHPPAEHIELYVLRNSEDNAGAAGSISAHLRECPGCRQYAEYLASFYRDVLELQLRKRDPEEGGHKVRSWKLPLVLHPFGGIPQRPLSGLLAAKSATDNAVPRLEPLASFSHEPEDVLLRLVLDRGDRTIRVSLHQQEFRQEAGILVSFPALEKHLLLDVAGNGVCPMDEWPLGLEWSNLAILVRYPSCTIHLDKWDEEERKISWRLLCSAEPHFDAQLLFDGAAVSLRIDAPHQVDLPALAAYQNPGRFAHLAMIREGRALLPLSPHQIPATMYLFH
jgi:hypothetical protein